MGMVDPGTRASSKGGPTTVFLYEYITGGGLAGQALPASLAAEGGAMRRALIDDFAALPDVRVVTTLDARLGVQGPAGVTTRLVFEPGDDRFLETARQADHTLVVAPETGGVLLRLTRTLEDEGLKSLGSSSAAVALTGDKARMYAHLVLQDIPTPRTVPFNPRFGSPEVPWDGPSVIKPVDGAGSIDTFLIEPGGGLPDGLDPDDSWLVQPYLEGEPFSASFLVDRQGRPVFLAEGTQSFTIDSGRFLYQGGRVPIGVFERPDPELTRALESVHGLLGFVGVDYFCHAANRVSLLEINPRPTTSLVGLVRIWPAGTIARLWLDAASGELDASRWDNRAWQASERTMLRVLFQADGTINEEVPYP